MKKALPIGTSNYQQLKTGGYYVIDKTLLIQEYLERKSKVTLITRPRRFGKTSAMSMMSEFFDITKDSKDIFKDTKIINTEYAKEMNQYPTIFISFADCKGSKEYLLEFLFEEIRTTYEKYEALFNSELIGSGLRERIQETYQHLKKADKTVKLAGSLKTLCEFLAVYYKKSVMLFIDEYDTPFIEAHVNGYYKEVHDVLASILRTVLKDNDYLQYAMLTGIQRVAKENIFSDLNNLKVYTVRNNEYAQYFGFTKEETKDLLAYYDLEYNDQVKDMYDGYRIGGVEIYNPWSIINYADEKELRPYWVNTSSNGMIKKAMAQSDNNFQDEFECLIQQEYLDTQVNMETSFYEQSNTPNLWGLFVNAGYLTIQQEIDLSNKKYRLRIPNAEVVNEFKDLVASHLHVTTSELLSIYESFVDNNEKKFIQTYRDILLGLSSYHDLKDENSYHTLMLGICLYVKSDFKLISNREEGKGRCDLILKAKKQNLPSYILEFKYTKNKRLNLCNLAKKAIDQIIDEKYDHNLKGRIIYVGLAHRSKDIEMIWKERNQ